MPETIKKNSKKNAPILCAVVVITLLAICIGIIIFPLLGASYGDTAAIGFLSIYIIILVVIMIGILIVLCQRLKEIEGGEEEDAKIY